jgi:hypothetical protein
MLAILAALLIADPDVTITAAVVQGTVESKATPDAQFVPVKAGAQIPLGSLLHTGAGAKALFEIPGSFELRVNEQTEIVVEGDRKMLLKSGRVFLKIPKAAAPFEIATDLHPVKIDECVMDMEYKPRVPNGPPAATTYMVLEGKMQTFSKKFSPVISAGWWATGFGGQLNTPDSIRNSAMDTAWVHSLLVERGKTDEETLLRTDELLTILANVKENDPAEAALRSLGELAAPGIARWLGRSVLETQVARRAAASRTLADAATMKSAPLLSGLLTHEEAQVRVILARGLTRLAGGKDLGYNDGYWKGDKLEAGQKAWEEWVKQNAK